MTRNHFFFAGLNAITFLIVCFGISDSQVNILRSLAALGWFAAFAGNMARGYQQKQLNK